MKRLTQSPEFTAYHVSSAFGVRQGHQTLDSIYEKEETIMADNPLNGLSSNKDIAGVTGTNTAEPRVASVSLGGRMDPSAPASSGPVLYPTGSMGLMATAIPHPPLPSELEYGAKPITASVCTVTV